MTEAAVSHEMARRFSDWQISLVPSKESSVTGDHTLRRQELLRAASDSSGRLFDYLTEVLQPDDNAWDGCPSIEPIDASEMHSPCLVWERHIGQQMNHVTRSQALSPPWWYLCHATWMKDGTLPNPPDEAFKCRVSERVLGTSHDQLGKKAHEEINKATRMLLRWLGGLPHVRHAKSVTTDSPVARAFWRYRMAAAAAEAAPANEVTPEECHQVLLKGGGWGRFVSLSQLRYSSLLHPRAFAALCVNCMGNGITDESMQTIARRCLDHHPGLMAWDRLAPHGR